EVKFDTNEVYVMVAIELDHDERISNEILNIKQWKHRWGATAEFNDKITIITDHLAKVKTPHKKFAEDKTRETAKKDRDATAFMARARLARHQGRSDECAGGLDELPKSMPATATEQIKSRVAKYVQVRDALAKPAGEGAAVAEWRKRLSNYSPASSPHYVM